MYINVIDMDVKMLLDINYSGFGLIKRFLKTFEINSFPLGIRSMMFYTGMYQKRLRLYLTTRNPTVHIH